MHNWQAVQRSRNWSTLAEPGGQIARVWLSSSAVDRGMFRFQSVVVTRGQQPGPAANETATAAAVPAMKARRAGSGATGFTGPAAGLGQAVIIQ